MNWLRMLRVRVFGLLRKQQLEAEMEEELRFHLAMRVEDNLARGMSPDDALREARRQLGNRSLIKEEWRDERDGGALEVFWRDLCVAARRLKKERSLTVTAVLALALGIGANIALFTVMRGVLLRPLPYAQSDELMRVWSSHHGEPGARFKVSFPDFLDLRSRNQTFESLGAFVPHTFLINNNTGATTRVPGAVVSSEVFSMLGARAALGRGFGRSDDKAGTRVVVISERLWEERFARAANVTDAHLTVDEQDYAIIGVMPREFRFPIQADEAQLWMTFAHDGEPVRGDRSGYASHRDARYLHLLGRLKAGCTAAQAEADLNAIAHDLASSYPQTNTYFDACVVTSWLADLTSKVRPALLTLSAAAGCLLCIACANIANLLFARGAVRQPEIAIRAALGADRRRIVQQLLTENLLLAVLGGIAGLLIALLGTRLLVTLLPADFPRADEIMPDAGVLGFAIVVTLASSVIFGFAPAWRSARCELSPVLKQGQPSAGVTRRRGRFRNGFIFAEIVLSLVLLACASCLTGNLWRLQNAPLGLDPQNVLTASVMLPNELVEAHAWSRAAAICTELLDAVRELPGVASVSAVSRLPALAPELPYEFQVVGRAPAAEERWRTQPRVVLPDYFRTLGIAVKEGREFEAHDLNEDLSGVIVNETFARTVFPNEKALGQRIILPLPPDNRGVPREIIGIVADVRSDRFATEQPLETYVPYPRGAAWGFSLLIRTGDGNSASTLLDRVSRIAMGLHPNIVFYASSSVEEHLDGVLAQPRLNAAVLVAFASVGVVLTAVGVYGVMAYWVARRRYEIGLRLAFGATKGAILQLILGEAAPVILLAVAIGSLCSVWTLSRLGLFLHEPSGQALLITSLAALLVSTVAFAACWLPARRAARQDPLAAIGSR